MNEAIVHACMQPHAPHPAAPPSIQHRMRRCCRPNATALSVPAWGGGPSTGEQRGQRLCKNSIIIDCLAGACAGRACVWGHGWAPYPPLLVMDDEQAAARQACNEARPHAMCRALA